MRSSEGEERGREGGNGKESQSFVEGLAAPRKAHGKEFGQVFVLCSALVEPFGVERVPETHRLNLALQFGRYHGRGEVEPLWARSRGVALN